MQMERCPDDIILSCKQFSLSPVALGSELLSVKAGTCLFSLQGECCTHMRYIFKYCEAGVESSKPHPTRREKLQIYIQMGSHIFAVVCMLMCIKTCSVSCKSKLLAVCILPKKKRKKNTHLKEGTICHSIIETRGTSLHTPHVCFSPTTLLQ